MTRSEQLPHFTYFPDPVGHGCVIVQSGICACCATERSHRYVGPRYGVTDEAFVCPWCIADGRAYAKWKMILNDVHGLPATVPRDIMDVILYRTPGYESWQGNRWLFSANDAMLFVGEVTGKQIIAEGVQGKITACFDALAEWQYPREIEALEEIIPGGQPAIYLFQDRATGAYAAYADMT
jgi:uncharacterized protein